MRIGLGTIVAGRRTHLHRQAAAVHRYRAGIETYVIGAMDKDPVRVPGADTLRVEPEPGGGMPLSRARNRVIAALADCDLAILIDADCIPDRAMVARYAAAAAALAGRPALLCGPVGYLRDERRDALALAAARRRVIRDFPATGIRRQARPELFWSLSFAISPAVHAQLGGFDETYTGWGAEDTDYGLRADAADVGLWFVAGAWAYHQPHPPSAGVRPAELAANARRFHHRWGFWPMPDVLTRLVAEGTIEWTPHGSTCQPRTGDSPRASQTRSATSSMGKAGPASAAGEPRK